MEPFEILSTLAEIAVALAGFSAIIVAFRRSDAEGGWRPEDVFRFREMLGSSLMAALFAVMPAVLSGFAIPSRMLWRALGVLAIVWLARNIHQARRMFRAAPRGSLSLSVAVGVGCLMISALIVQAFGVVGWGVPLGPAAYVYVTAVLTLYAGTMFYRLVLAPIERTR